MHRIIITFKDGKVVEETSNMDLETIEFVTTEMWEHDDSIAKIEII